MTKNLKRLTALLTAFVVLVSMLMYFPVGTFGSFGLGVTASAATLNPSSSVATEAPTSGNGTLSNPYIITNKAQLYWLAGKTNFHAKLGADIVVNAGVLDSNGDLNPGTFDEWPGLKIGGGSFDGDNHTISGIIVNQPDSDYQGFITGTNLSDFFTGKVKNLNIDDSYIKGNNAVGGICGNDYKGLVSNCSFYGTVIGNDYVGGICGHVQARNYIVEKCTNKGKVSGRKCVGGIVGYADCLIKIDKCINKGKISGTAHVGGIAGNSKQSLVKECWNEGDITGGDYVAGVVGYEHDTSSLGTGIRNCYNIGKVSGDNYVAGIAANVEEIEYCYNIGEVTGTNKVYGVGSYSASKVSNCYYDQIKCPRDDSNSYYATKLDTSAFTSGEVAFKLRGSGDDCWGQNLDDASRPIDAYPILSNGDSKLAVYYGQDDGGNAKYHNHLSDTCQYCPFVPINPDLVDGKFVIDTPNKLYWFAMFVNGVSVTNEKHSNASAVLAADIELNRDVLSSVSSGSINNLTAWTPIGDNSNPFTGSFDGQGHTISGLYFNNDTTSYAGLFGAIGSGGSVSNVGIVDSYFNGTDYVGCIAGANEGTISGCFSTSSNVAATGSNKGGICGSGATNVNNSYTALSGLADSTLYIDNSAFGSGEVAYKLNGDQTKLVWGQNVDTVPKDPLPTAFTPEKRVYKGINSPFYHNHASGITYCAVCPTYLPKEPDMSGDIYQISDVNELFWFAGLVNGTLEGVAANKGAKGVLTTDIILENRVEWTPIGSSGAFTGSFDGQCYTISGLIADNGSADNIGLFGVIGEGGRVSNVGIVDSSFNGNDYVGAVAGMNDGTIIGCFSTSTVSGASNIGGISGNTSDKVTNSCYLDTGVSNAVDNALAKNSTAFESGEVAYLLNGDQSSLVWGQTLEGTINDLLPVRITGENEVYCGTDEQGLKKYHNHADDMEFCSYCSYIVPVIPQKNGDVYQICTARELYGFAALVNGTVAGTPANPAAKGVLVNNITIEQNADLFDNNGNFTGAGKADWTPIGDNSNPFIGSFDGNGYTISGLYADESADNIGLFGVIGNGGGVSNVGVIDSYFSGNDYVGAIAGKNNGTISGCFSTSTIEATSSNKGGISGNVSDKVTNSFFLVSGVSNAVDNVFDMNDTAFTSGEVAYLLNGNQTKRVWGQTLSGENTDALPVPINEANRIYYSQGIYHNHSGESCDICNAVLPTEPALVDGVYQMTKASELEWFARFVNSGNTTAKGILKNNIVINADVIAADGTVNNGHFLAITTIGTQTNAFDGLFNGDGYTISGLYFDDTNASNIGLISYAGSNAQISKVRIADSYFNCNENIGGICGNNAGNISECCSENCVVTGKNAGGLCGSNSGTIKNCYNTGKVSGDNSGGICGNNNGGTVSYCYNLGELNGNGGGICGAGSCEKCYYIVETALYSLSNRSTPIAFAAPYSSASHSALIALAATYSLPDNSTPITPFALTNDDIISTWGAGSEWEKTPNNYDNKLLYFPKLSAIKNNAMSVTYTPKFVLENTNTNPIVYKDDLTFTFDAVLDVPGFGSSSAISSISPTVLREMDFKIIYNDNPANTDTLSTEIDIQNQRLVLKMGTREVGYITYDVISGKIKAVLTEDINAGNHKIQVTYTGTNVPHFTGVSTYYALNIGQATPTVNEPTASDITYGQSLSASVLSDTQWSWVDGTIIPTVTNTDYAVVTTVDDVNYNYTDVDGYSGANSTVTRIIPVSVAAAVPKIVVTADAFALPGSTVNVSAEVSNPNNSTLTDLPDVSQFTYRIDNGEEQTIANGSFVVPEDTPINSTITITVKTPASDNYTEGSGTATVSVVIGYVSAPVISPNGGTFSGSQEITITCETIGANIYYTTDGTTPTISSTKYTGAFTINETTTIKAIAAKPGMGDSEVVTVKFTKLSSSNTPTKPSSDVPTEPSSDVPTEPSSDVPTVPSSDSETSTSEPNPDTGIAIGYGMLFIASAVVLISCKKKNKR